MTVDFWKLNSGVTPVAAAVPDALLFLQQMNAPSGTGYAIVDLAHVFLHPCT